VNSIRVLSTGGGIANSTLVLKSLLFGQKFLINVCFMIIWLLGNLVSGRWTLDFGLKAYNEQIKSVLLPIVGRTLVRHLINIKVNDYMTTA